MNVIEKLTDYFMSQVGYLEKESNKNLEDFKANAGYNNYTKYGAYFGHNGPDAYWCDYFVDYCFCQVSGREKAVQLLGGLSGYTPTSAGYFKRMGQWHTKVPQAGDIIFFENSVRINHTGYVYKAEKGMIYTIEGNTSAESGVAANGGGVAKKSYANTSTRIVGYGRPDYALVEIPVEYTEGWQRAADGRRWWYQYRDGSYAAGGWVWIGGNAAWYLFDHDVYMLTGYQETSDGRRFFLWPSLDGDEGKCMVTADQGNLKIAPYDWENRRYVI